MKLTELTPQHLIALQKLSEVVDVKFRTIDGETCVYFWSGDRKLSDTKLTPHDWGFTVTERYDTYTKEFDECEYLNERMLVDSVWHGEYVQ